MTILADIAALDALPKRSSTTRGNETYEGFLEDVLVKLRRQVHCVYQEWLNCAAPTTSANMAQFDLNAHAQAQCPHAMASPVSPLHGRNLIVTGTQLTGATSVTLTLTGTDYKGDVLTEEFTVTTAGKTATGSKAFFSLTAGSITAITGTGAAGDLLDVGMGTKLGLMGQLSPNAAPAHRFTMDRVINADTATLDRTYNTVVFSHTVDGAHEFEMWYWIQGEEYAAA